MEITNAKYGYSSDGVNKTIMCEVDGHTINVPMTESNRRYKEILKQVAAGNLTIADADTEAPDTDTSDGNTS